MSFSNGRRLVGGAAAAGAIALLITPAQAEARPKNECYAQAGYQFPGGEVIIHYPETDAETRFNAPRGTTVNAPAETFYGNGTSMKGRVTGDITKGGNIIRLTVTRAGYAPLILDGAAMPNNTAAGSFAWENHDRQNWDSPTQLACIPGPPQEDRPPKPAEPKPVAAEQSAPPAQDQPQPEQPKPDSANGTTATQKVEAPPEPAAPAPQSNEVCIPDPFGLDFPGAC